MGLLVHSRHSANGHHTGKYPWYYNSLQIIVLLRIPCCENSIVFTSLVIHKLAYIDRCLNTFVSYACVYMHLVLIWHSSVQLETWDSVVFLITVVCDQRAEPLTDLFIVQTARLLLQNYTPISHVCCLGTVAPIRCEQHASWSNSCLSSLLSWHGCSNQMWATGIMK
jgi:hypothetical protein